MFKLKFIESDQPTAPAEPLRTHCEGHSRHFRNVVQEARDRGDTTCPVCQLPFRKGAA